MTRAPHASAAAALPMCADTITVRALGELFAQIASMISSAEYALGDAIGNDSVSAAQPVLSQLQLVGWWADLAGHTLTGGAPQRGTDVADWMSSSDLSATLVRLQQARGAA